MQKSILYSSLAVALCAILLVLGCLSAYGQKPNVIVILADDLMRQEGSNGGYIPTGNEY